jgi:hypothetical protein
MESKGCQVLKVFKCIIVCCVRVAIDMSLTSVACRIALNRPADLPSFAVLDLASDSINILNQLLSRAGLHGIETPPCGNFSKMINYLRVGLKDGNQNEVRILTR